MPSQDKKIRGAFFSSSICLLAIPLLILAASFCRVSLLEAPSPALSQEEFPNLIENGDLESYFPQTEKGLWQFDPEQLFLWDAFSHSPGSRSLFIDASRISSSRFASLSYRLRNIEPGRAYLFEIFLLRDRHPDGVYPVISLFHQEQRVSDFWAARKWQKIALFFSSPPRGLAFGDYFLTVRIPSENYLLWMDDLSLKKFDVRLLAPKNRSRLAEEFINLSWEIPVTDRLLEMKIVLSQDKHFQGNNSRELKINNATSSGFGVISKKQKKEDDLSSSSQRLSVSTPNTLRKGKWFWRVEVYQYKKLIALSEAGRFFVAKNYPGESAIQTKRDKPELIKGADAQNLDFFPLGIYDAVNSDFEELSQTGFNSVCIFPQDIASLMSSLQTAKKHNLKALVSPSPVFQSLSLSSSPLQNMKGKAEFSQASGVLSTLLPGQELLSSAAVLGWYLEDEPEGRSISPQLIFNKRKLLHQAGFRQLGAIALNRSWRTTDYASATDVFLSDPYPVPFEPLSWLSLCLDEIHAAIGSDSSKRVWAVIQAFGWNSVSKEIAATGQGRDPTPAELLALTYLAITHRAQGLFYYTYRSGNYFIKDKKVLWKGLKGAVKEARDIFPLLISPEIEGKVLMECRTKDSYGLPAVHYIVKQVGDVAPQTQSPDSLLSGRLKNGIYVAAVNTLPEPVQADFDLKNLQQAGPGIDIFSGEKIAFSGSRLHLIFGPLERKVLRLSQR